MQKDILNSTYFEIRYLRKHQKRGGLRKEKNGKDTKTEGRREGRKSRKKQWIMGRPRDGINKRRETEVGKEGGRKTKGKKEKNPLSASKDRKVGKREK